MSNKVFSLKFCAWLISLFFCLLHPKILIAHVLIIKKEGIRHTLKKYLKNAKIKKLVFHFKNTIIIQLESMNQFKN